ncbi:LysR family transcriptional regulator [Pseudooceanicola sp. CBS1P-1]|uniref:LysR family transcriptional regulator n=1 Tax=Pseudooceanicola albus TaxID=2692189 RepID=A0A6L7G7H0_9RHOB|nr:MULTISPECIES: LysR family transcriptional regulator [Pseudooceanicola]MBT9382882.1 LysR family transcriptional regulator [Pseudooceanicola endophyticus]MXN20194.1 LysR family transcriptional regulator [Pseudooceanicola albus]
MKWKIDDVPVFVAVVDHQGITAAARALDMPKSTVSAALQRLETALGLRLLDRNSRNLRVTSEGETFYRQSLLILEQVRETDATMAGLNSLPSGRLTISLPPAFSQEILAANLAAFRRRYPEIEFELIVTSRPVDLVREQLDAAIVVGHQDDSEMISKTLVSGSLRWVTTPAYLAAHPVGRRIAEIEPHVQICEKRYGQKRMAVLCDGQAASVDLARGVTHVNDPLAVRRAVLHGAGISLLPEFYCHQQLREGTLIEICQHITFDPEISKLSVVYPSRRLMSPKVRAFLEFLDHICRI